MDPNHEIVEISAFQRLAANGLVCVMQANEEGDFHYDVVTACRPLLAHYHPEGLEALDAIRAQAPGLEQIAVYSVTHQEAATVDLATLPWPCFYVADTAAPAEPESSALAPGNLLLSREKHGGVMFVREEPADMPFSADVVYPATAEFTPDGTFIHLNK